MIAIGVLPTFRRTYCLHIRVPYGNGIPQLYYHGITVDQPLHRGMLFMAEER
jgi:hypothetical protein